MTNGCDGKTTHSPVREYVQASVTPRTALLKNRNERTLLL
ncbi:hypothetical protein CKC_03510 [Candidatus Liberibacter solanacearum CLso-ZC1]|uniref:Uncharacterized protein n=1 Tax=Liberibacter solanacearum (strain CLso-ZC1) TaxID=658172 RepID=E4UBE6_LIBSC|nr:hypothetical protein CKC_03510 [Candidatus Liberibacter solanacearum CLso-ZC1]